MLLNIFIGAILMLVTTGIHVEGMILALGLIRSKKCLPEQEPKRRHIYLIGGVVLVMFLVSLVEVLVWAVTYLLLGAVESLQPAIYFSMVTFTTLGYGDITLHENWRLLSSFQAANGVIMFGWSTAIVIAAVQRIYIQTADHAS